MHQLYSPEDNSHHRKIILRLPFMEAWTVSHSLLQCPQHTADIRNKASNLSCTCTIARHPTIKWFGYYLTPTFHCFAAIDIRDGKWFEPREPVTHLG